MKKFYNSDSEDILKADKERNTSTTNSTHNAIIYSVRLKSVSFSVANRFVHNVVLAASRKAQVWDVDVKSDELIGNIKIPHDDAASFDANLDYLRLVSSLESAAKKTIDPKDVPPIKLKIRQFIYGDIDFGSLDLLATRHEMGVHLEKLQLE